jgi:hypothetical protein
MLTLIIKLVPILNNKNLLKRLSKISRRTASSTEQAPPVHLTILSMYLEKREAYVQGRYDPSILRRKNAQ